MLGAFSAFIIIIQKYLGIHLILVHIFYFSAYFFLKRETVLKIITMAIIKTVKLAKEKKVKQKTH